MMMLCLRGDIILRTVITVLIGLSSNIGDRLLYSLNDKTLRAISDNLTHAIVGGLSWSLIIKLFNKSITRNISGIILCFFISSFIDLDHFLLARSWKLRDATHLGSKRPILHCSLIPLLVWLIFIIIYKIFNQHSTSPNHNCSGCCYYYYLWIIITAFLSHHIRDSTRRGLWFGPFGSTPPLPYYFYIITAMGLPYFSYSIMPDDVMLKDDHSLPIINSILHV